MYKGEKKGQTRDIKNVINSLWTELKRENNKRTNCTNRIGDNYLICSSFPRLWFRFKIPFFETIVQQ